MQSKNKKNVAYFSLFSILTGLLIVFSSASSSIDPPQSALLVDTTLYTNYYLELRGTVRESKISEVETIKPIDSALLVISSNNFPSMEMFTNKKGKCTFRLPLDKSYKIKISKKGFASKLFDVNTKVPFDKKGTYSFVFDVDMLEEIKGLDVSVLKKPIAKVTYNFVEEKFAYDIPYTNKINAELKKMYRNYYLLQKQKADSVSRATSPR